MILASDIIVHTAERIGASVGAVVRYLPEIVGALGGFAILFTWMVTGGPKRD